MPVQTRVTWTEPLPMERLQRVSCQTGSVALTVELPHEVPVQQGEPLELLLDPAEIDFFDSKSGTNLALGATTSTRVS